MQQSLWPPFFGNDDSFMQLEGRFGDDYDAVL